MKGKFVGHWQREIDAWAQTLDKPKKLTEAKQELDGEIADILFALICAANREGIDIDAAMSHAMEKSKNRDAKRFKKKST